MTIYCIGRNYVAHAKELKNPIPKEEPVVFLKSQAALRGLESSPMAFADEEFHFEAELVLKLGQSVPFGTTAGWNAVSELGLGLDVTRRSVQNQLKAKGLPWTTAKSFQGSAILSPMIAMSNFAHPESIVFSFCLNGTLKQRGQIAMLIFPIPQILSYLASLQELCAGDLIYTGTPEGVGTFRRGDQFTLAFEGTDYSWNGVL